MSKIGFIGLGKLGLPVALAVESKGHTVFGYDINPNVATYIEEKRIPYQEKDIQPLLDNTKIKIEPVSKIVSDSDIIFVAIQTPHDPKYEGTTRLPDDRKDFDYTWLKEGIKEVAENARKQQKQIILAVISTCLPGTFNKEIKPLLNEYVDYVYTPQFIAMGTVIDDYLNPEFNLVGVRSEKAADQLERFYTTINSAPNLRTDITTAEAIKVSYNTFITMKTVLANTWGEIAHKVGANVDDIYKAWCLSEKRLLSPRYLQAGMGDGGGCHPRDNIALSWMAKDLKLSHNIFEDLMYAREDTEDWHAKLAVNAAADNELPLIILGRSFKPETNIEVGSPSILMANIVKDDYVFPYKHYEEMDFLPTACYFIGTKNAIYRDYKFPHGSVVLDPFGYIPSRTGITVKHIGRMV